MSINPLSPKVRVSEVLDDERFRWCIHSLPIFASHERNGEEIDERWLKVAANRANRASMEDRNYLSSAHTKHHPSPKMSGMGDNRRMGFLSKYWAGQYLLEGNPHWVLFADVLVENDEQLEEIKGLPYRSVEVADLRDEWVGSLAFMATEEPWFHFPHPIFVFEGQTQSAFNKFASISYCRSDGSGLGFLKNERYQMEDMNQPEQAEANPIAAVIDGKVGPMVQEAVASALEGFDFMPMIEKAVQAQLAGMGGPAEVDAMAEEPTEEFAAETTPEEEKKPVAASRVQQDSAMYGRVRALQARVEQLESGTKRVEGLVWAREQLRDYPAGKLISDDELNAEAKKGPGALKNFVNNFVRFSRKATRTPDFGTTNQGNPTFDAGGSPAGAAYTPAQATAADRLGALYDSNPSYAGRFTREKFIKHNMANMT